MLPKSSPVPLDARDHCSIRRAPFSATLVVAAAVVVTVGSARAQELRIPLPKRDRATPVQKLNRDGVKAIEKHQFEKAKRLFFRAYLLDPNDPFTLNNLGYISELEGDVDRAQRYYELAQQQPSEAVVDMSNNRAYEGKPVDKVAGNADDIHLKITRLNLAAIGLLQKDRAPEADLLLQQALTLDPKNPFTLNNLGYAKEKEGELETALKYYNAAALGSQEKIVVTVNKRWRGRPISEVAADNAEKVRDQIKKEQSTESKVARLNLEGVSAMNRNDRHAARQYFQQAYKLDPRDAFTLNNMGYVAEMDGDRETANFYYDKARRARHHDAEITVATRREVEGHEVGNVAAVTNQAIDARMQAAVEAKRRQGGPILLMRRDNTPVIEPAVAPRPAPSKSLTVSQPAAPPPPSEPPPNLATPNVPPAVLDNPQPRR
ncbi:MAG: tetratricopeptide repeat protein [Terriglobales bacterium]